MTFYAITNKRNPNTNNLLQAACKAKKVGYREIDEENYTSGSVPQLGKNDALYRVTVSQQSMSIERDLINTDVKTLYQSYEDVVNKNISNINTIDQVSIHQKNGLPIPKTLLAVPHDNNLLKKQAEETLGDPPYVIKVSGGSQGLGVIRVDSFASLFSVAAFIRSRKLNMMIREYIPVMTAGRLLVLGDEVIASLEFAAPKDDFRSNVIGATRQTKEFPKEVQKAAITAVHSLGYEYGGVDVLTNNGSHYIAEVNFPCVFIATTEVTGIDVAGQIIDYLVAKQK